MLNILKGNQDTLKVTLDRAQGNYFPGETVQATVYVEPAKELKIQEGRIVLICRESFQYRTIEHTRDSKGHTSAHTVERWMHYEHEAAREPFLMEGTLAANVVQTHQFAAKIPENSWPSLDGRIVKVQWLVKATLDRKLTGDVNTEAVVNVLSAMSEAQTQGSYGQSSEPGEAMLSLELPGTNFLPGELISGNLLITAQKKFDANEVRVELAQAEYVSFDQGNHNENTFKVKLAGKTKFNPGETLRLPFQVQLPNPCPVSAAGNTWWAGWKLRGVLNRFLRKDTMVEQELKVYSVRKS